jgi:MFS family permease
MVMPAIAALGASNYERRERALMYGVLGGVAGAGIAVGPIVGGAATEYLSWRVVFAGEVILAIAILIGARLAVEEAPREASPPKLDVVGAALSFAGMAIFVYGILQASTWGWIYPKDSPIEPFGFSLAPFVVALGAAILVAFAAWQRRHEDKCLDPLVHFRLLTSSRCERAKYASSAELDPHGRLLHHPLYLQIVQGLNAFETGLRMLPISITLVLAALVGSGSPTGSLREHHSHWAPHSCCRLRVSRWDHRPELNNAAFAIGSALLGLGMGFVASQLGTCSSRRSATQTEVKPAPCRTPLSSWDHRSGRRSLGRS